MGRSYEYYVNRWLEGINMRVDVDYADPKSVQRYNKGSDVFRKAAARIGELYPEKVAEFAAFMEHENEQIRLYAAISVAQYMPHTREQLTTILKIIHHKLDQAKDFCDRVGWEWWLEQSWAQEENCVDFEE